MEKFLVHAVLLFVCVFIMVFMDKEHCSSVAAGMNVQYSYGAVQGCLIKKLGSGKWFPLSSFRLIGDE